MISKIFRFTARPFRKEMGNYFLYIFKAKRLQSSIREIIRFCVIKFFNKQVPLAYRDLLPDEAVCIQKIRKADLDTGFITSFSHLKKDSIKLATVSIDLELEGLWNHEFTDPEDCFSLHRFGWILPLLERDEYKNDPGYIVAVVLDWIGKNKKEGSLKGWDSYSVSERIVNWIYLIRIIPGSRMAHKNNATQVIRSGIQEHLDFLRTNLEFRHSATNNHLINNARAIYLAGVILSDQAARELGSTLLRIAAAEMFSKSGFLREGSSHYQLLMARTYLEVFSFAQDNNDTDYIESMGMFSRKIVDGALYFLSAPDFPIFGDISPDFQPSYHMGLLAASQAILGGTSKIKSHTTSGWHTFYSNNPSRISENKAMLQAEPDFSASIIQYPDSGHYKISCGDYVLYFYVNPMGYIPEYSHGHCDIGSFILYIDGKPVFVDTGRFSFENSDIGNYGKMVCSHNSISIEGRDPGFIHGVNGFSQIMLDDYLQKKPEVNVEKVDEETIHFNVKINGFKRIWPDLIINRSFFIKPQGLTIEDQFQGNGLYSVDTFFHCHPDVMVEDESDNNRILILNNNRKFRLLIDSQKAEVNRYRGEETDSVAGWFFPEYGRKIPTENLVISQTMKQPFINRYNLTSI